ncbi:MAG: phosphatase PAP2 family protein [Bacteroidales bacterium]|nr:phosphatase PAP2 family protein [Bacteroidales bacterium]
MIEFLQQIDADALLTINGWHNEFWDIFMRLFSGKWIWVPLYASLLFVLVRRYGWKGALGIALVIAAVIAMADQTCATIIRPWAARLRPANLENPLSEYVHIVNGYRGGAYGFPSCHAANTFALATLIFWMTRNKALGFFMLGWALINCYSRMYLGVHYPGDLIAGAAIGAAIATISYLALKYWVEIWTAPERRYAWPVIATGTATAAAIAIYAIATI